MHQFFYDIKSLVLDTLFPVFCLSCGKEGIFLCPNCLSNAARLERQVCVGCEKASLLGFTHPKCATLSMPEAVISVFSYRDPKISKAIIYGKYYFLPDIYKILALAAAAYLEKEFPKEFFRRFVIVPLPLARSRLRWRGFNQSEIVARIISQKLNLRYEDIFVRNRNTFTQKDLNKQERRSNVAGAFGLKEKIPHQGLNYLLIDDVVTTGATLVEATKVLKRSGASKVWCVTLARD